MGGGAYFSAQPSPITAWAGDPPTLRVKDVGWAAAPPTR